MTTDASYPRDLDDRCGALHHDDLTNAPTVRCIYEAGHAGTHHHTNGTTWGHAPDWGITSD